MEPSPPYEQLDFPPASEYSAFSSVLSTPPVHAQEEISQMETIKTPLVLVPENSPLLLQAESIQTDALNDLSLPEAPSTLVPDKEHIAEKETIKTPLVLVPENNPLLLQTESIQTDAPNDPSLFEAPLVRGQRLSLPSVSKSLGGPRQSRLLGDPLEILLKTTIAKIETVKVPNIGRLSYPSRPMPIVELSPPPSPISFPLSPLVSSPSLSISSESQGKMKRGTLLLLLLLTCSMLFQTMNAATAQFIGPQGWAYVLGGPVNKNDPNLLANLNQQLHNGSSQGAKGTSTAQVTLPQYIDLVIRNMSLEQKLGQMMIVQFVGGQYSLQLSTMISQYDVGSVLIFKANSNIQSKEQLTSLIQEMQINSKPIPLTIAIDQEGGAVDRLVDLDGARPSESSMGATNDPNVAKSAGLQDAQDLSSYGINLNLAPVVDVTRVYNAQLATRTYGGDPTLVANMAAAYLQGLQQSGKVLGTIKHFPGLGDVSVDPHIGVPVMHQTKSQMEQIDWAPYRALIQQNQAHVVMVTHEIVTDVDPTLPSTLSKKVVTGILRDELGFQGVIMTDSLSMSGVTSYTSEYQAAADAIEAGVDMVMGAATPEDVSAMYDSIKQAISSGALTTDRIDASVRRILMMKYSMGLLALPSTVSTGK